jgi:signal transduction histidine kinase
LLTLARRPFPSTWLEIRHDPGAVLLLLRRPFDDSPFEYSAARLSFLGRLPDPAVLDEAARMLDAPEGFVDWGADAVSPVYDAALTLARLAEEEAATEDECAPEEAWACGLMAPLGWFGICAVAPSAVAACLGDRHFADAPSGVQRRVWGMDQAALARRLARHWRLPRWLSAVVGCLDLPAEAAIRLGADPALTTALRRAVDRARQEGIDLGLCRETATPPGVTRAAANAAKTWTSPHGVPLLPEVLRLAAENHRLTDAPRRPSLEAEVDHLHQALADQAAGEDQRLQDGKLAALAEFAAGAGHEINNPLAVISGQAQYLLSRPAAWAQEDPEAPRKALQIIIAQTQRVHGLLRDLMQFARPAKPRPAWFDLPMLTAQAAAGLADFAASRGIRVEIGRSPERLAIFADAEQVRAAVTCLLRNAIEAAPPEGWARVVVEPAGEDRVAVAVEDSGSGPDPAHRESLFDPFFSGRAAGRGRGLGLPTAWRLARQQGGALELVAWPPEGPTRFLLTLPIRPDGAAALPARLAS